jgi:hypothetical protein
LPGYQYRGNSSEECERYAALQVKAIYNALKYHYNISYVGNTDIPFDEENRVQYINYPDEVLNNGYGNCIELTLLMASALESIGMDTYIIFVPSHAYLMWDTDEYGRSHNAIELTGISEDDFETAYETGNQALYLQWPELIDNDPFDRYHMVCVERERYEGVTPNSCY